MIKNLIRLANNLDSKGLRAEADALDSIIQKWAGSNHLEEKKNIFRERRDNFGALMGTEALKGQFADSARDLRYALDYGDSEQIIESFYKGWTESEIREFIKFLEEDIWKEGEASSRDNGDSETAGVSHDFLIEAAKAYALSNKLDSGNLNNRESIQNWLMTSFRIDNGQAELAIRGQPYR